MTTFTTQTDEHRDHPTPTWRRWSASIALVAIAGLVGLVGSVGPIAGLAVGSASAATTADPTTTTDPTASPAPDTTGNATFGLGPASGQGQGDGRSAFNYVVTPGAALTDAVTVSNIGLTPLVLTLYATDAVPGHDGSADLLPAATAPTDSGSWITLAIPGGGNTLAVAPRSSVVVPLRAVVPPDAHPGDHAAGIVASLPTHARNSQGLDVQVDQRVVSRVFFRVSGDLHPQLTIAELHAHYEQNLSPIGFGTVVVTYTVRNDGNIKLGDHDTIDIAGPFGTTAKTTSGDDSAVLLPGAEIARTVRLEGVPPELYGTVHVQAQPLAAPGDVDAALDPVSRHTNLWTFPLTLSLIVAVVVLAAWYRRRRRRRRAATATAPPAAKSRQKVSA